MIPDDESILSAYLDDELDPEERRALELVLETDLALAARLRELRQVHDAVYGMSRPSSPCDVRSAVMSRVLTTPALPMRRPRRLKKLLPAFVALGAIAASSLMILIRLPIGSLFAPSPTSPKGLTTGSSPLVQVNPSQLPHPILPGEPNARPSDHDSQPNEPAPALRTTQLVSEPKAPTPSDLESSDALEVRKLLANPKNQRILILTDVLDAPSRVHHILETTARKSSTFGTIQVHQGIVIDPQHPDQATVFAVVMDARERQQFLNNVKSQLEAGLTPEIEPAPRAELLAQLSDSTLMALSAGKAGAGLDNPPADLPPIAIKAHPETPVETVVGAQPDSADPKVGLNPTPGVTNPSLVANSNGESGTNSNEIEPGPAGQKPTSVATETEGPELVLVWVTKKPSG